MTIVTEPLTITHSNCSKGKNTQNLRRHLQDLIDYSNFALKNEYHYLIDAGEAQLYPLLLYIFLNQR